MQYGSIPLAAGISTKKLLSDQVQFLTDHTRRISVKKYASVMLDEKTRLMEGNQVVYFEKVK
jgi:hypothetical protein